MNILVNKNTKMTVQGFTGKEVTFHAEQRMAYGTNIVGGVTPHKGGQTHLGKPVSDTVADVAKATGADVSLIFVPAFAVGNSVIEAADAGIKLAVVITEYTPVKDMMFAKQYANKKGMEIIEPNCPGIITSEKCKLGIILGFVFKKGCVGLISKSGTLTYETANQVIQGGYGISTVVGTDGDPIIGLVYKELLSEFEKDNETKAIVMIGGTGGNLEVEAAKFVKENISKPVVAFTAGAIAPGGKRMGHTGTIVGSVDESTAAKKETLKSYGVHIVDSPALIGEEMQKILG